MQKNLPIFSQIRKRVNFEIQNYPNQQINQNASYESYFNRQIFTIRMIKKLGDIIKKHAG